MHAATLPALEPGQVTLEVLAIDDARGNFGMARRSYTVGR
jgi:hypothetical protein